MSKHRNQDQRGQYQVQPDRQAARVEAQVSEEQVSAEPVGETTAVETQEVVRSEPQPAVGVDPVKHQPVAQPQPAPAQAKPQSKNLNKESNVVAIEQQLISYVEEVKPSKALSPATIGQWQKSLYQLLISVLGNQDPAVFRREWNTVLNVANKNREGVFHENYIFRAPQHWGLSDQEATLFRRILSVILETANPENRQGLTNRVLLERATQGMTEVAKNNFLNFYA